MEGQTEMSVKMKTIYGPGVRPPGWGQLDGKGRDEDEIRREDGGGWDRAGPLGRTSKWIKAKMDQTCKTSQTPLVVICQ